MTVYVIVSECLILTLNVHENVVLLARLVIIEVLRLITFCIALDKINE